MNSCATVSEAGPEKPGATAAGSDVFAVQQSFWTEGPVPDAWAQQS